MSYGSYKALGDMADETGRLVEDVSAGRRTDIKQALAREYDAQLSVYEWPQLVKVDSSGLRSAAAANSGIKTLETGEAEFPLPFSVGRLKTLQHQSVDMDPLEVVDTQEFFDRAGSNLNTTGIPWLATEVGRTAQWQGIPTGGDHRLSAICSVATNDNLKTVRVWYRHTSQYSGEETYQDLSGTFSTGVPLASAGFFEPGFQVAAVLLPDGWIGDFKIQTESADIVTDIQPYTLPASTAEGLEGRLYYRKLYRCYPVPAQDYGLTITWWTQAKRLVDESDIPVIPISGYLVEQAAAMILHQMGRTPLAIMHERAADRILKAAMNQNTQAGVRGITPRFKNLLRGSGIPTW